MMIQHWLAMAGIACLATSLVQADELVFNNGDRLSGTVVSLTEGKLTFDAELLGQIEVDAAQLQSLSTAEPIEIHMADGTVFRDQAVRGESGELRTAGSSPIGAQSFQLTALAAINPPPEEPIAWQGDVTAGLNFKRGNSIEDNGDFNLDALRESEQQRIRFETTYEGERVQDDAGKGTTNERKIEGELKYDYFLGERWYWFARTRGEKDGVKKLDLRYSAGGGPGYRWWATERTSFDTEASFTWTSEHYEDSDDDEDYLGSLFSWRYNHRLTDSLRLFSKGDWLIDVEEWDDRFTVDAEFGLRNYLTSTLFLEAKIEWDYDAEPSGGTERRDTEYGFAIGYAF
jgi:putative salt-induced outer membrane protein YdiY